MVRGAMERNASAPLFQSLQLLFHDELNPVAPKAQGKVQVPEGLDLDARIHEEEEEDDRDVDEDDKVCFPNQYFFPPLVSTS